MIFAELPPSKQWAALKYRGEKFAEVWFKPEGEPFVLTFRIPQENFQIPSLGKQLTMANLLKAVGITTEEVESWRHGDVCQEGMNGSNPDFKSVLPPPQDVAHLDIYVRLQPPPSLSHFPEGKEEAEGESSDLQFSSTIWQELEPRWKGILGMEATMDALRLSMEALNREMETSFKKTLTTEEKLHAFRADIAQWEKAKKRIPFALPKMKDFIHRSIWALGSPERKRLEEVYKEHIQPQIPFPRMNEVLKQLEDLQKDRQVLFAHGSSILQECRGVSAEVQGALRTLQNNAAANAMQKKGGSGGGGKFFKDIRRMSGA